jgi:malonyl CoA-acyl carrier protein transacylase
VDDDASALEAVMLASEALQRGDCDLAVALALANSAGGPPEYAGVLLERSEATVSRRYAVVRSAASRPVPKPDHGELAEVLAEACSRCHVKPETLTLLGLHCQPTVDSSVMNQMRALVTRKDGMLPHCNLGPCWPSSSPVTVMMGFCAVILALHERVLPPVGIEDVSGLSHPFCADHAARPWIEHSPRRAAVVAGTVGSETAIVVEQSPFEPYIVSPRIENAWPAEALLLSAGTRWNLLRRLESWIDRITNNPSMPLRDLVADESDSSRGPFRAAIVATTSSDLREKLSHLAGRLWRSNIDHLQTPGGVYFSRCQERAPKTVFLMPGQGSQYSGMFRDLCLYAPHMQVWFERLNHGYDESEICPPAFFVAPPGLGMNGKQAEIQKRRLLDLSGGAMACLAGSLGLCELLTIAGVRPDAMLGYSSGENAALLASGTWRFFSPDEMFEKLATVIKSDAFEGTGIKTSTGQTVAVNRAPRELVAKLLATHQGKVFLALDNCPDQMVLFGEPVALGGVIHELTSAGAICMMLPFTQPHHTPLYQPHADVLLSLYRNFNFGPPDIPLYSCAGVSEFPDHPEYIRKLAVRQWTETVRFREMLERLYQDGFRCFVEVGPGGTLTSFVRSTLKGRSHTALATNLPTAPGLEQLLKLLGQLFVLGHEVSVRRLWSSADRGLPSPLQVGLPLSSPQHPPQDQTAAPGRSRNGSSSLGQRIVEGHFDLMRQFLDGQQRMHQRLMSSLVPKTVVKDLSAVKPNQEDAPWPLLGPTAEIRSDQLTTRRTFTLKSDPFLTHHAFGQCSADGNVARGLPVIPFTFGMEMVAEAAYRLTQWPSASLTLQDLRALRWLAVDKDALTVEIEARLMESPAGQKVHVRVFEISGLNEGRGRSPAFEGFATPTVDSNQIGQPLAKPTVTPAVSAGQFNDWLFHGAMFRSVHRTVAAGGGGAEIEAIVPASAGLFAASTSPRLRTPASLLDAAGQIVAYWLMEQGYDGFGLFPVSLDRYLQFGPPPLTGIKMLVRCQSRIAGQATVADIEFRNVDGSLLALVKGLRMRMYAFPEAYFQYVFAGRRAKRFSQVLDSGPDGIYRRIQVGPESFWQEGSAIWQRVLARLTMGPAEKRFWHSLPAKAKLKLLLSGLAAKELALDLMDAKGIAAQAADIEAFLVDGNIALKGELVDRICGLSEIHVADTRGEIRASFAASQEDPLTPEEEGTAFSSLPRPSREVRC